MDSSPLNRLPEETLHQIFFQLPLRQIATYKCVCKALYSALSSPSFRHLLSTQPTSLSLIALKPSDRHISPFPTLHAFDPALNKWLRFSLSFLPFSSLHPITSSDGLLYLWAALPALRNSNTTHVRNSSQKSLVVCNPLTRQFKILPQLGSAWSRHGSVLAGSGNTVLVLTELAILYYSESNDVKNGDVNCGGVLSNWLKFTSNLPSKPRSPVLVSDVILALCDVGSPWRSQWAIFKTKITNMEKTKQWVRVEKRQWGDIFGILKRPRLVKARNDKKVYMVGGLKSSFALQSSCTTILILRLDLESLEWEEVGRMPVEMYKCFMESSKFKVFGGGNKVCFSAKRVGRLVLWEESEEGKAEWRWIEGLSGNGDGLCRGFVFDARLDAVP
ncbi:SKP1-interacting partner 15 [Abeliophyllum distichum]|uniref:SKP1-interacting partner 15 n=1 Tax=Abeliophyllum distichum TaxID=126358 RepID=A0ABD1SSM4_9LAMI